MQAYKETLTYLDSLTNYEKTGFGSSPIRFDLEKLRKVLREINNPQEKYKVIHIAGTKGKGSVSTITASILKEAGYKVGLYTSPHLITPRERISINDDIISEEDFSASSDVIERALGDFPEETFTYFEFLTLMAMWYFAEKETDFAVFETGLGGRLDATNVLNAMVCAITPISYDHTQVLGNSLAEIASEKADIIKEGSSCISAKQKPEAFDVIEKRCKETGSSLTVIGRDVSGKIRSLDESGGEFDVNTTHNFFQNCRINLAGKFQILNSAQALAICEKLITQEELNAAYKKGLENAFIPGRMETVMKAPLIVIDGAQNCDSARSLKRSVEQIYKYDRLILLLGMSNDKDVKGICDELSGFADEIILTRAGVSRAQDPHIIRGYLKGKSVQITSDTKEALGLAFKMAGKRDLILATGSFYVISEIRELIKGAPEHQSTSHF